MDGINIAFGTRLVPIFRVAGVTLEPAVIMTTPKRTSWYMIVVVLRTVWIELKETTKLERVLYLVRGQPGGVMCLVPILAGGPAAVHCASISICP